MTHEQRIELIKTSAKASRIRKMERELCALDDTIEVSKQRTPSLELAENCCKTLWAFDEALNQRMISVEEAE